MSSAAPTPLIRLRTFGGLAIEREGSAVSGAGAQRRPLALLAQLAAAGDRGISRAKLVGTLWPDSDEEKARRVLAQTLYSLRRDLDADDLIVGTSDLRLNAEVVGTDLGDFNALADRGELRAAATLYEGPFLDGFYLPGAPDFERWAEECRASLASRYVAIVERLAEDAAKKGASAEEVAWRRKLAAADPLSAKAALRLMEALARSGDRAGALQHARVHEALMRAELDVGPDASVAAYADRLRVEHEKAEKSRPVVTKVTPPAPFRADPSAPIEPTLSGEFGATQEWMLRLAGGRFNSGNPPLKRAGAADANASVAGSVSGGAGALTPIEPIPAPKDIVRSAREHRRGADASTVMPPGTSHVRPPGRERWRWIIAAIVVLALVALAILKVQ